MEQRKKDIIHYALIISGAVILLAICLVLLTVIENNNDKKHYQEIKDNQVELIEKDLKEQFMDDRISYEIKEDNGDELIIQVYYSRHYYKIKYIIEDNKLKLDKIVLID